MRVYASLAPNADPLGVEWLPTKPIDGNVWAWDLGAAAPEPVQVKEARSRRRRRQAPPTYYQPKEGGLLRTTAAAAGLHARAISLPGDAKIAHLTIDQALEWAALYASREGYDGVQVDERLAVPKLAQMI